MNNEIFISIAACKEKFLVQTIKSALANAKHPDNLYFGIFNTVIDEEDSVTDKFILDHPNIYYMEARFPVPLGTGWSRLNASLLSLKRHKYFLQIDAHTIFEKNWDELLITSYNELLNVCDKPVISSVGPWWAEDENDNILLFGNPEKMVDPYNFDMSKYNYLDEQGNVPSNSSLKIDLKSDQPNVVGNNVNSGNKFDEHGLLYGSFLFSDFEFNTEMMHDPRNIWEGDQLNFSLRAFSQGYRSFTLNQTHLWPKNKWNDKGLISDYDWRTARYTIHDNHNPLKYKLFSINLDHFSKIMQSRIFGKKYFGYWGAKNIEEFENFEKKHGINFAQDAPEWPIFDKNIDKMV